MPLVFLSWQLLHIIEFAMGRWMVSQQLSQLTFLTVQCNRETLWGFLFGLASYTQMGKMDIQRLGGGITVHSGWALIAPWRNQRTKLERWWWDFKFDHLASSVSLKFFFHMICYRKLSSIFDKQFHILLFKFGICNLLSLGLSPGLGHFQASLLLFASWRFLWDPPKTHPKESRTEEIYLFHVEFPCGIFPVTSSWLFRFFLRSECSILLCTLQQGLGPNVRRCSVQLWGGENGWNPTVLAHHRLRCSLFIQQCDVELPGHLLSEFATGNKR